MMADRRPGAYRQNIFDIDTCVEEKGPFTWVGDLRKCVCVCVCVCVGAECLSPRTCLLEHGGGLLGGSWVAISGVISPLI